MLISAFLFNLVVYAICVAYRPTDPDIARGFIYAASTRYGTRYVSAFESFWITQFWEVWAGLFLLVVVLKASYRGRRRIQYDPLKSKVVDEFAYEEGDVSKRRFLISAAVLTVLWWMTAA